MQMLLVDFGNSRLKWVLHDKNGMQATSVVSHRQQALDRIITQAWSHLAPPERVVIASVADPSRQQQLAEWVRQHWSLEAEFIVSPARGQGMTNGYTEPDKLGCDRWAAMVAAYRLTGAAVCVVDCGSAVTIDVVDDSGQHLGGMILPGIHTMLAALSAHTSLPQVDLTWPPAGLLGKSTQDGIACGISHAIAALVNQTLTELTQKFGRRVTCYLTGGDASIIQPLLHLPCEHDANLVLRGLAIIASAT